MHLDFASTLNLISTATLIGALIFTGMQVRQANRARRDRAAVTVMQTSLSENSALMLDLFGQIPDHAPAETIDQLDQQTERSVLEFGLRLEVIGYMVFRDLVDLESVNDMAGGAVLAFWSRAEAWSKKRRQQTGHEEFLEWCEWLARRIVKYRAAHPYQAAHLRLHE